MEPSDHESAVTVDDDTAVRQEALRMAADGQNIFLTGEAGAGKTRLLSQIVKLMRKKKGPCSVLLTASTGVAANGLGQSSQTMHRAIAEHRLPAEASAGDTFEARVESFLKVLCQALTQPKLWFRWFHCTYLKLRSNPAPRVWVLDEASMVSEDVFFRVVMLITVLRRIPQAWVPHDSEAAPNAVASKVGTMRTRMPGARKEWLTLPDTTRMLLLYRLIGWGTSSESQAAAESQQPTAPEPEAAQSSGSKRVRKVKASVPKAPRKKQAPKNRLSAHSKLILPDWNSTQPILPLAGMQMIAVGDFMQLPPVQQKPEQQRLWNSEMWQRCNFHAVFLRQNMRQGRDVEYAGLLRRLRRGELTQEDYEALRSRVIPKAELESARFQETLRRVGCVSIVHTNEEMEKENQMQMDAMNETVETHVYPAHATVAEMSKDQNRYPSVKDLLEKKRHFPVDANKLEAAFRDLSSRADRSLSLCVGAKVVMTANMDVEKGLCNGTFGCVIGFREQRSNVSYQYLPIVQFQNVDKPVVVSPTVFSVSDNYVHMHSVRVCILQLPLRQAWSITAHRAQGMTLPAVKTALTKRAFGRLPNAAKGRW